MTTDDRIAFRQQLVLHEGWRLKPYVDSVGKITIGVGRNLTDRGLSPSECDLLLMNDIDRVLAELHATGVWFEELDGVRQRVVADLSFNLGLPKFLEFYDTRRAIQRGEFDQAAQHMLESRWATQVGQRAQRLAQMMKSGKDYAA